MHRARSSAEEHSPYKRGVAGSNPAVPTQPDQQVRVGSDRPSHRLGDTDPPCRRGVGGQKIKNSSPPKRLTVSVAERTVGVGQFDEEFVASVMPEAIVNGFESIQIAEEHDTIVTMRQQLVKSATTNPRRLDGRSASRGSPRVSALLGAVPFHRQPANAHHHENRDGRPSHRQHQPIRVLVTNACRPTTKGMSVNASPRNTSRPTETRSIRVWARVGKTLSCGVQTEQSERCVPGHEHHRRCDLGSRVSAAANSR